MKNKQKPAGLKLNHGLIVHENAGFKKGEDQKSFKNISIRQHNSQ